MEQIAFISNTINEQAVTYSSRKDILLILGIMWAALATIIGLWIILRQK